VANTGPDSPDEEAARARLAAVVRPFYPDKVDSERIVRDAGLTDVTSRVYFEKDAASRWRDIFEAAFDPDRIDILLATILADRPDSPELVDAVARWHHRHSQGSEELSGPRPQATSGVSLVGRLSLPPLRPLVDRVETTDRLRTRLAGVTAGTGSQSVIVLGDSGVGKTRVVQECISQAVELDMMVLLASCVDRRAEALLPIRSGLGQLRGDTPVRELLAAGPTGLVDYAPFVESFLGLSAPRPLGGSSPQGVSEGLAQVLLGLAATRGLCLVLDDITDADDDTLGFVEYLAQRAASSPVATIVTAKEDLLDDQLSDRLDGWRARGSTVERLAPFGPDDLGDFVSLLRGGAELPPHVVEEVFRLTGGNAFFAEQVVGLLDESPDAQAAVSDVPDRVDAVLGRRLRRVPAQTREFLEAASVALDVTHTTDLLAHLAELDQSEVALRVGECTRDRYLTTDTQGHVAFGQELLQRVLRGSLLPQRQAALDLRAAEWLEGAQLPASACHHYEMAGRSDDMVRTALAGAQQAEDSGYYATAVQLYLRAWPVGDQVAIGIRLAGAYLVLGSWPEAEGVLDSLPADLGAARMLRSSLHFVRGSFDKALRELRLATQDPKVDRTAALIRRADINLYLGNLHRAMELCEEALVGATHPTDRAQCFAGVGASRYHLGDLPGAEEAYRHELDSLPAEVEQRDRFAYTLALYNQGLVHEAHDDWLAAKDLHAQALRVRKEVSAAREVGHSRHAVLRCELALGNIDAAREQLAKARAAAVALGEELELSKLDHTEGQLVLGAEGGDVRAAIRLVESARDRFRDLGVVYDVAHASFTLVQAYSAAGATRRALEEGAAARAMMHRGGYLLLATKYPEAAFFYHHRVAAGLLAFAAGDAVGLPWERRPPSEVEADRLPLLVGTAGWAAGSTSDDTALTVLVAEHLVGVAGADARGFLERLAEAAPSIHGLGPSTSAAVEGFRTTGALPTTGGTTNGALMRSLPVGWAFPLDRVEERRDCVVELSRATHTGLEAIVAACVGAACAAWALEGAPRNVILDVAKEEAAAASDLLGADPRITAMLAAVSEGTWAPNYQVDQMDPYETVGRVLACLEPTSSMREAVLSAVRLGGDTDTVAALVGGLLGCGLEVDEVREQLDWLDDVRLPPMEDLQRLAAGLSALRIRETDG
jgi:ADP-ribosylglycohydrolase/tetratricopeptide (TPR) repeat protein